MDDEARLAYATRLRVVAVAFPERASKAYVALRPHVPVQHVVCPAWPTKGLDGLLGPALAPARRSPNILKAFGLQTSPRRAPKPTGSQVPCAVAAPALDGAPKMACSPHDALQGAARPQCRRRGRVAQPLARGVVAAALVGFAWLYYADSVLASSSAWRGRRREKLISMVMIRPAPFECGSPPQRSRAAGAGRAAARGSNHVIRVAVIVCCRVDRISGVAAPHPWELPHGTRA